MSISMKMQVADYDAVEYADIVLSAFFDQDMRSVEAWNQVKYYVSNESTEAFVDDFKIKIRQNPKNDLFCEIKIINGDLHRKMTKELRQSPDWLDLDGERGNISVTTLFGTHQMDHRTELRPRQKIALHDFLHGSETNLKSALMLWKLKYL